MPRQSLITDQEILEAALVGLQSELGRVNTAMADIAARLGQRRRGRPASTDGAQPAPRRRRISAAARKRIGDATRKRWAAYRAAKAGQQAPAAKPKRKMSRAGRARIIAATKAHWARVRKEKAAAEKQRTAKKTASKLNARKPTRNGEKPSLVAAITPTASARS
jgi:hypothetical protein